MSAVLANLGRVQTYGGGICAIIISLSFICAGVALLMRPKKYTKTADATVTSVTSNTATISYLQHSADIPFTGQKVGQTVKIYYDPKNEKDFVLQDPQYMMGWVVLGIGILVSTVSSSVMAAFSKASEDTKALVGGVETAGTILRLVNPSE